MTHPLVEEAAKIELGDVTAIDAMLRRLAAAAAGPIVNKLVLNQIKRSGGIPIKDLAVQLALFQRDLRPNLWAASVPPTEIRDRYVFVKSINSCWDRMMRTVVTLDAIRNAHWSEMPGDEKGKAYDPAAVLIRGDLGDKLVVDKADTIGFLPGAPEFVEGEGGARLLNIWVKSSLEPVEGDVTPFLDHIDYLFDGERQPIEWFLDWLAHLVQRPAVKIFSAVLIIGPPGIGKSLLAKMMIRLLGRQNVATVERSNLISQFNEWMDGSQLVIVHELMMGGDRQEAMDRLKSYITEPEIRINRKNVASYKYENRANFLMFSNHLDAASIEKGDRRYFVWVNTSEPKPKELYAALMDDWFDKGGASALLWMLQNRDLSNFNPSVAPIMTPGKVQVMQESRAAVEAYLQDAFDAVAPPLQHDLVVVNDILDYLAATKSIRTTHKVVSGVLRDVGGVCLGQKHIYGARGLERRKPRVWAIRDPAEWECLTEDELRQGWRGIDDAPLTAAEKNDVLGRLQVVS